jgi:hypothetical protein
MFPERVRAELAKAACTAYYSRSALGPMKDTRPKARALGILLSYTKARPAERAVSKANNLADEWVRSVLQADHQRPVEHRE